MSERAIHFVDFNRLPGRVRDRLVRLYAAPGEGRAAATLDEVRPADPPAGPPTASSCCLGCAALLLPVTLGLLVLVAANDGSIYSPVWYLAALVALAGLFYLPALAYRRRTYFRSVARPYARRGALLLPRYCVDLHHLDSVSLHPIEGAQSFVRKDVDYLDPHTKVRKRTGHFLELKSPSSPGGLPGYGKAFPSAAERDAALAAFLAAREVDLAALARGDVAARDRLDPFHDLTPAEWQALALRPAPGAPAEAPGDGPTITVTDPRPPAALAWASCPAFAAAFVASLVVGTGICLLRDHLAFNRAKRADLVSFLEGYLERGGRLHRDEVERDLIPRAEFDAFRRAAWLRVQDPETGAWSSRDKTTADRIAEHEAFLARYPDAPVSAEVRAALEELRASAAPRSPAAPPARTPPARTPPRRR